MTRRAPELVNPVPAELAVAGGVREHTPGALARLSAMFATALAPSDATWF
jgi:hypothetical protein